MNYFSRVSIDPTSVDASRLASEVCGNGYREHQHLWRLFETDPDAKRDFLFRQERLSAGFPRFYLLSNRRPRQEDEVWHIETKEFRPVLHSGQRLAFSLRVNPVVTRRDEKGRQQRHDVVMDLKYRNNYRKIPESERPSMTQLIEEGGRKWLSTRAERNGFCFLDEEVRIEGYQQYQAAKRGRNTPIQYSTLDFAGLLTVEDTSLFQFALSNGIGPAKAFGCGLLMLRRL